MAGKIITIDGPGGSGKSAVARLLADFGHDAPPAPMPAKQEREPRVFRPTSPRGPRKTDRGWAPARAA